MSIIKNDEEIVDLSGLNMFENIGESDYTEIPNTLFDDLMPLLEPLEFKVTFYIYRNLYSDGEKNYAWFSNEEIITKTGISEIELKRCFRTLKDKKIILIQIVKSEGIKKQIIFLNNEFSRKILKSLRKKEITVNELLGIKENN